MEIVEELLPGVFILKNKSFQDDRGILRVPFHAKEFQQCIGHRFEVTQTMFTQSTKNVLRGLHYQNNTVPVAKLISCTRGRIYDVIVDLRSKSETFGKWGGVNLNSSNGYQIYAPIGTAHGFVSTQDVLYAPPDAPTKWISEQQISEVFYYQAGAYNLEASCILAWNDPDLAIDWPVDAPKMSDRDRTQGISWASYKNNPTF